MEWKISNTRQNAVLESIWLETAGVERQDWSEPDMIQLLIWKDSSILYWRKNIGFFSFSNNQIQV